MSKNIKENLPYNPTLQEYADKLRKAGILSEALLWRELKKKQFRGLDFDRQKVIGNYIVDFYCAEKKLVIEIDGISHTFFDKGGYDEKRDNYLKDLGLTVVHLLDKDVRKHMSAMLEYLEKIVDEL